MRLSSVFFLTMGFFFLICAIFDRQESFSTFVPTQDVCALEQSESPPAKCETRLALSTAASNNQSEIEQVNAKIEELEEMKMGYNAKALRHEDQAERMQFENRMVLETRRHLELAQENREKAAQIQREIDQLKAHRDRLIKGVRLSPPDGFEDI